MVIFGIFKIVSLNESYNFTVAHNFSPTFTSHISKFKSNLSKLRPRSHETGSAWSRHGILIILRSYSLLQKFLRVVLVTFCSIIMTLSCKVCKVALKLLKLMAWLRCTGPVWTGPIYSEFEYNCLRIFDGLTNQTPILFFWRDIHYTHSIVIM